MFIRVSNKTKSNSSSANDSAVAICATRIAAIMGIGNYQARTTVQAEKKSGRLINAAGRRAIQSVIILDNGAVVASPFTVSRLLGQIDRTGMRSQRLKPNDSERVIAYEIEDDDSEAVEADESAVAEEEEEQALLSEEYEEDPNESIDYGELTE